MQLGDNHKKQLVKDFKLPINTYDDERFHYFIDLYDNVYKTKEKLAWLEEVVFHSEDKEFLFNTSSTLRSNIKSLVLESPSYKKLVAIDVFKEYPMTEQIPNKSMYIEDNLGHDFISIDLEKANFNSLMFLGLGEDLGIKTYQDLMGKFTDFQYYHQSKMLRQAIFGELEAVKQQKLQKHIMSKITEVLKPHGYEYFLVSSDELILTKGNLTISHVQNLLSSLDKKYHFFKIEKFHLEKFEGKPYYTKYSTKEDNQLEPKLEFKQCPIQFFAQIYKHHFGMELNSLDMSFYYEGMLAEFKEPIFKQKSTLHLKNKF